MPSLRLALRGLGHAPGFTTVAVALVAIGLAASTTAFTLVDTLFFRARAGIADPATLYNLHPAAPGGEDLGAWSWIHFQELRAESRQFDGLAAFSGFETGFAHSGRSRTVETQLVSANFFDVIGVRPALGRFFLPDEDQSAGTHPVAVLSHRLWQGEFAGRADILGTRVQVNGETVTVIGVAPPGFHGTFIGFDFDLWLPVTMARAVNFGDRLARPEADWLELLGRPAAGVAPAAARAELQALATRQRSQRPAGERTVHLRMLPNRPIDDSLRGGAIGFASALSIIAALVLVTACLNVGGLLLTRAEERRRESAVRLALGAGRGQLLRLWFAETGVIFLLGSIGGLLLTVWIADLELFRSPIPLLGLAFEFPVDLRTFAFCLTVTLGLALLTALVPALRAARSDLVGDLKLGSHGPAGPGRLRQVFVTLQLAFALVPVVAAGLFARTLAHAASLDPGFAAGRLLVVPLNLPQMGGAAPQWQQAARRLVETARARPGVADATLASRMPMAPGGTTIALSASPADAPAPPGGFQVDLTVADPAYFDTLGLPLLAGRAFASSDTSDSAPVAIVNATAALRIFGRTDVLDREVRHGESSYRIVGVVRDAPYRRLWEEPRAQIYRPVAQSARSRLVLAVRVDAPLPGMVLPLAEALRAAQPDLPLPTPLPATAAIDFTLFVQRLGAQIAAVLGATSLLLAAVGLYGMLALASTRQRREFGLRLALGARPVDLSALVVRRVLRLVSAGLVLGGGIAFGLTRLLEGLLHGVTPIDFPAYGAAAAALGLVAVLATWLPARRASKVDPMVALRNE